MTTRRSKAYLLFTLGFLTALSPLVTDMYLPCLPAMASDFKTTPSLIQMSLMACMLGLSLGQLLIGPLSDKYGRKAPLLASLILYALATIACIFTSNIYLFVALRLIQGMAGSGGTVISRSVAADVFCGKELADAFSWIAAILGFAPVGSPVLGGLLLEVTNWQGIFAVLLLLGLILLAMCWRLEESLPHENRAKHSAVASFQLFFPLLRNRRFMLYVLTLSFSMAAMFSYLAASPFIFQKFYGLSPLAFSFVFGGNAVGLTVGSFLASRFARPERGLAVGAVGLFVMGLIAAGLLILEVPFAVFESALFVMLTFAGLTFPTSATLALETERRHAGTASALLGSMSFAVGGICSPLVGIGNILHSTALAIFLCASVVVALTIFSRRTDDEERESDDSTAGSVILEG